MATHAYIRAAGVWNANQLVTHGEFAALDFGQFDSISCSGGTYAPAGIITIGGAGVTMKLVGVNTLPSGEFDISGTGTVNVNSGGSILVNSSGVLNSLSGSFVQFGGANTFPSGSATTFLSGASLTVACASTFSGAAAFTSPVVFSNTFSITSAGTVTVACAATFSAAMILTGTTAIGGAALTISSGTVELDSPMTTATAGRFAGRVVQRVVSAAGTAGQTASPLTASFYWFPSAAAGSTIQINDTGAVDGDQLIFASAEPTNPVLIKNPGGATITGVQKSSGTFVRVEITRIGGVWVMTDFTVN